ncbi:MAG: GNAT family N-acetyltransferase [Kangiellaceae bacterium]|jgi:DNA-binding MarR family transcriptional regulator/ribosomal protein S18 acetylase RimI-like enzyme
MQSNDFLDDLGELALGSRLKRLSDGLMADAAAVYKSFGLNIQPKWFALLALLYRRGPVSIVEASELLGLSQPAISQFVKELTKEKLIVSQPSKKDSRKKFLKLTTQGDLSVQNMQLMWHAVDKAAKELCQETGVDFYSAIKKFEQALSKSSLAERTNQILSSQSINPNVEVLEFTPELAQYFKSINSEWIEDMFEMEESDKEILNYPEKIVIDKGGKIYFAKLPKLGVVGTCALLKKQDGSFELTKMGVLAKARGEKIGETLLAYVVEQATKMETENLFLLTNKKCAPAIHLYLKAGFKHDLDTMKKYGSKYERCNVAMRYFSE